MSSISREMIDLSECAELRWLASVVADIAAANPQREPILIGALARDVLLRYAHGIDTGRATEDADFAIAVADWDDFQQVKDRLLAGGEQVRSVCLPMLVALKLIAWDDRRERADDRDAEDLMMILENYLEAGNLTRYPQDAEHVLGNEFDYAAAGALLVGRDLRGLLTTFGVSAASVHESLGHILNRELASDSDSALSFAMAGTSGGYALNLIRAFRTGLNNQAHG